MHVADSDKLLDRLRSLPSETEWVEFKHNHFDPKEIGENIAALANSAMLEAKSHAFIVFGIKDKTHEVVGTNVRLQNEKVGAEPYENWLIRMLDPKVGFQFLSVYYQGHPLELIVVDPAYERPVRFQNEGFIRIGSVTKKLVGFPQKEGTLWQLTSRYSFEDGIAAYHYSAKDILANFDCEALETLLFKRRLKPKALIDQLLMVGLIIDDMQGCYDITNLFALLAANDLNKFKSVANKAPRVITYKGSTRLNGQSDRTGLLGYAVAFPRLLAYVMERSPHKEVMQTGTRQVVYDYPEVAVREFIANALIHQDLTSSGYPRIEIFNNRIEISDPGSPLVSIQRFIDAPAKSRNEKLAGLMRQIGFCEERGSGVDRAITAIEAQRLPPPSFQVVENTTVVTLFRQKEFGAMSKEQRRQACYLHACLKHVAGESMSNGSLRLRFGLTTRRYSQISLVIADAIEAGLIKPSDEEQGNRNARYVPFWAE